MDRTDLTIVKSLLLHALQLPEHEREQAIAANSEATGEQKRQTLELLRARDSRPQVLSRPLQTMLPSRTRLLDENVLEPGEVLVKRYQIRSLLSRTASSQVFLASDLRMANNEVAVKMIPLSADRFNELQDQLWREIRSLARIQQQSVSGLIDTGIHNGHPFLVLQYFPGPTLDQWLEMHKPDAKARMRLFRHLIRAIEAIHAAGLLHLDLKPQNIIVSSEPDSAPIIRILDFGTSVLSENERTHRAGTPIYAAPERSLGIATPASDVYSLACIGMELLTSRHKALHAILHRAISEDSRLRPQTAAEFRAQLDELARDQERNRWLLTKMLPAVLLIPVFTAFLFEFAPPDLEPLPTLKEVTSLHGAEFDPALSADGETIYFGHESDPFSGTAIYKVPFGGGNSILLFAPKGDGRYFGPHPSPDGKLLAFSEDTGTENYIVVADLAANQKRRVYEGAAADVTFSADPNRLYFSELSKDYPRGELRMLDLATGQLTQFPSPPSLHHGDQFPAPSPDGRHLAFMRYRSLECADLYVIALDEDGKPKGEPHKITSFDVRLKNPQWRRDGKSIVFSAGSLTRFVLYSAKLASNPLMPAVVSPLPPWGAQLRAPATAAGTDRFVFVGEREDCEIYRFPLSPGAMPERFLSSSRLDEEPRFSPDGKYVSFVSERSGSLQGWVAKRDDLKTPILVTNFEQGEKAWPAWTPSGSAVFFARQPTIGPELVQWDPFLLNPKSRSLLRLDHTQRVAGIAADGSSIFAEMVDRERPQLQRWSLLSDRKEVILEEEVRFVREYFRNGHSGERLTFFSRSKERQGLFLIENGKSRLIYPSLSRRNTFTYHNGFVYLAAPDPQLGIYKIDIHTGKVTLFAKLDRNPGWGMDISPDGKELLIALFDFDDTNLVAAEWPMQPATWRQKLFERLF